MNRRGHLSSKIPNVKLRPAPEARRRTRAEGPIATETTLWSDPEEDEDEYDVDNDLRIGSTSSLPWSGIVLTFTGVEGKTELGKMVRSLGGVVETALTIKVTHVIAKGFGSPKYLYAVDHRIPVLSPSWIVDAHASWVKGDELDVPSSIERYRLQAFVGLKIAVSGIDQLERRREIIRHINLEGGVYSKELDRSCTHLISAHGTREKVKMSEKVKWAVKEMGDREAQKRRGARLEGEPLRIVYEEWVWDCVGLRGRVKEESYDARVPRRAGRVSYESVMDGTAFLPPEKEAEGGKNVDEEENAPVKNVRKRKHETMENLVGELLGEAKAEPKEQEEPKDEVQDLAEDNKSEVKPKVEQPAEAMPARDSAFEVKQSVLHASRSTAFSIDSPPSVVTAGPSRLSPPARGTPPDRPAPTLFAGLRMSHAVSEGYEVLEIALKEHGATLVREQDRLLGSDVDYLVVRLASPNKPYMPPTDSPTTVVTDCWVEACCYHQRILSPDDKLVFRPLSIEAPLQGADALNVHISGFSAEIRSFLRRIIRTVGGTISDKFSRHTTHLVCAESGGLKFERARMWKIPAVRESWIWGMAESGAFDNVAEHLHDEPPAQAEGKPTPLGTSTSANVADPTSSVPGTASTNTATATNTSSTRALKPTPTHIEITAIDADAPDPAPHPAVAAVRSPPSAAALTRGNSMPPSSSPSSARRVEKAATVAVTAGVGGAVGAVGGTVDVTAALRRLAEAGSGPSTKVRRSRPSNTRQRDGTPLSTSGSPRRITSIGTERRGANPFPVGTDRVSPLSAPNMSTTSALETPGAAVGTAASAPADMADIADETMRVRYNDPVGERERRRMIAAVMGESPRKRTRL